MRKNSKGPRKRGRSRRKKRATRHPSPLPGVPAIYNVEQAADALKISRARLYEIFVESPGLRSFHIGSRRLVTAAAIQEYVSWLESREQSGKDSEAPVLPSQSSEASEEASAYERRPAEEALVPNLGTESTV